MAKVKTSFFAKIVEHNLPNGKDNAILVKNGIPLLKRLYKRKKKLFGNCLTPRLKSIKTSQD